MKGESRMPSAIGRALQESRSAQAGEIGVVFRYQDPGNHYGVSLDAVTGNCYLFKAEDRGK